MTDFVVSTVTTSAMTLTGFDDGLITQDGVIHGSGFRVISTNTDFQESKLTNLGLLLSDANANAGAVSHTGAQFRLTNGLTGQIIAVGSAADAIRLYSTTISDIVNAGFIQAGGVGLRIDALDGIVSFSNSGIVDAGDDAVRADAMTGTLDVRNSGTINAGSAADVSGDSFIANFSFVNSGTINTTDTAFNVTSYRGDTFITNTGVIVSDSTIVNSSSTTGTSGTVEIYNDGSMTSSTSSAAFQLSAWSDLVYNAGSIVGGINFRDGGNRLTNSGDILGDVNADSGSDSFVNTGMITGNVAMGDGLNELDNAGEIQSGVVLGTGADIVRNSGTIAGSLALGDGADLYRTLGAGQIFGDVSGEDGDDLIVGGNAGETFDGGAGFDTLRGKGGEDLLIGAGGSDSVGGGFGDDELRGGQGADTLRGGRDDDSIAGGGGGDLIVGGHGNDTMSGQAGADVFVFLRNNDEEVITDFTDGQDKIDLTRFGLDRFADLRDSGGLFDAKGDTLIDLSYVGGRGTILMEGFDLANLNNQDFII